MIPRSRTTLLLAVILAAFVLHAYYLSCVAEDAYITFRFARNLADGNGLVWNVGEGPVEGFTNFLWVILCAGACKLGLDIPLFSQVLGLLTGVCTLMYTFRFAREVLRMQPGWALVPCALLAAAGPMACWATSGMETALFGLLVLVGCFHCTRYGVSRASGDLFLAAAALFLATLTRPEGFMVFTLVACASAVFWVGEGRVSRRAFVGALLVYAVPFIIYYTWRYRYFGYPLPNTFYAKTGGTIYQYLRGIVYTSFFALHFLVPALLLPVLLLWERGSLITWRRPEWISAIRHDRPHTGLHVCVLVSGVYTAYIVCVGGDYMAMYRFFVPVMPLMYLLVGFAGRSLYTAVKDQPFKRKVVPVAVLVSLAGVFVQSTPLEMGFFQRTPFTHGTYRGVQQERWHCARLKVLGEFFADYAGDGSESLSTDAIGVISFCCDMKVYGKHGLVDPTIAHGKVSSSNRRAGWGFAGHERGDMEYTLSKRPTYIMIDRNLTPEPSPWPDFPAGVKARAEEQYRLKSVWLTDPANGEEGYFTFLERKVTAVDTG